MYMHICVELILKFMNQTMCLVLCLIMYIPIKIYLDVYIDICVRFVNFNQALHAPFLIPLYLYKTSKLTLILISDVNSMSEK